MPAAFGKSMSIREVRLMRIVLSLAILLAAGATTSAQEASIPDVLGVWTGQWRAVIYGHNHHHPPATTPAETTADAPRVREIGFTMEFEGQDGRLVWGHSWSDPARKEPFAATFTADGKRILGADTDGSLDIEVVGADRMEACYSNSGLGPAQAIVAACGTIERTR